MKSKLHLTLKGNDELAEMFKDRAPGSKVTLAEVTGEVLENTASEVVIEVEEVGDATFEEKPEAEDGDEGEADGIGDAMESFIGRS